MDDRSRVLHLLTTRGRIRVSALRAILAQLSPELNGEVATDSLRTYKLCRLFDMLGHAELHRGRPASLSIASPHLGRLPVVGKERYLLSGARTSATVDDIRAAAVSANLRVSISESAQHSTEPLVPCRILLEFDAPDDSRRVAETLGIGRSHVPPAWTLACFSRGLTEFEASFEWHPRNGSIRGVEIYDPSRLAFIEGMEMPDGPFLCRSIGDPSLMFAVNGDQEARIDDPDFGRHWALAQTNVAAILHDRRKRLVAVPTAAPLPRILARALCLCSGYVPSVLIGDRRKGLRDYLVFADVPAEVADKVTQKLGAGFVPQTINTLEHVQP